jgi:Skp family chaperone for outer membrane proteins
MGLFDKVVQGVSNVAASASVNAVNSVNVKKIEVEISDLNNKYNECYIIIGKRIADSLRSGDSHGDSKVNEAFGRIKGFDQKKSELEAKLRELKGESAALSDASKLIAVEAEAEKEIEKCKHLLELGVDSQEDFDRKVATIRNKVTHYKKLDALDQALARQLITEDIYKAKKAEILGEPV